MISEFFVSDEIQIKNVKILTDDVLGTGSYGVVYRAVYHGTQVAAKKLHGIFFEGVSPAEFKGILLSWQQELKLMNSLRHPNIVQFYGVYNSRDPSSPRLSGDSYIVSELMVKSLQARNSEQPRLNFRQIVDIAMDIASGLCYLHNRDHPIMHRDLASKNILLSVSGQAKIADLGVAKITLSAQASHTRHPGTDLYMPVEAVIGNDDYNHSIDVYGLGVIILELSIGRDPTATQCLKLVNGHIEAVPEKERRQKDFIEYYRSCSKELEDVIMSCLKEKEFRITATEVVEKMEKLQKSNTYTICENFPTSSGDVQVDKLKLSAELEASKKKFDNLKKENDNLKNENDNLKNENNKLAEKFERLQQEFQQLSNKNVKLSKKLKDKEKELKELKNSYEVKLSQLQTDQHTTSTSNTDSFLHPTYNSQQSHYNQQSTKDSGPVGNQMHDQRSTYQRRHSAENHSTQLNNQKSTYQRSHSTETYSMQSSDHRSPFQRSHSAYAENHSTQIDDQWLTYQRSHRANAESGPAVRSNPYCSVVTGNCLSLPTTFANNNLPLINLPNTYESHYLHDQGSRSPLQHEDDHCGVTSQFHSLPTPVVTSKNVAGYNAAQHSNSAKLTVQEANEYLTYQVSCMDRVINQLMNPNNSESLQSSFVQTLKEQIVKTDNYIRDMPFFLRSEGSPIARIEYLLNKLFTANIRITHGDRQELDGIIFRLRNTIEN